MNNRKIAIIGCGWLGFPLAKHFLSNGYAVSGTTTSVSKLPLLSAAGIDAHFFTVYEDVYEGNLSAILKGADTLILNLPPKLRKKPSENYVKKIKQIAKVVQESTVTHVLFVSSTSVYGNPNNIITEDTITAPTTESGKQLLASENILLALEHMNVTIIRFGGLIGNGRHPVYHLIKRNSNQYGKDPVNLIHLDDCIAIIFNIVTKNIRNEVFNAVAPYHPDKINYYNKIAKAKGLKPPLFEKKENRPHKIIASGKLTSKLQYTFLNLHLD